MEEIFSKYMLDTIQIIKVDFRTNGLQKPFLIYFY